jgi:hypothetical protein
MTAAIFGLIGVIVGGLLNALVAMANEAHRDRRAVMAAARLLVVELAEISATCKTGVHAGSWVTIPSHPLETAQWKEYRTLVASQLRAQNWRKVWAGFDTAVQINRLAEGKKPHEELSDVARESLWRANERADVSIAVLEPYVRGEHLLSSRLKRRVGIRPSKRDDGAGTDGAASPDAPPGATA